MKTTTLLSALLLVAFFLPWVDFSIFIFSGYQLPKAIHQLSIIGGADSSIVFLVYLVYLIPILSSLNLLADFKLLSLNISLKKFDFYLAIFVCVFISYVAFERSMDLVSFFGIGFLATAFVSIIGLFVKNDKVIFELPMKSKSSAAETTDITSQLEQLKDLLNKELISTEEYQQKKEEILKKIN